MVPEIGLGSHTVPETVNVTEVENCPSNPLGTVIVFGTEAPINVVSSPKVQVFVAPGILGVAAN